MVREQSWPDILKALTSGEDLSVSDASWCMNQVMNGTVSDAQLGGFLIALSIKGETVNEIVGFRDAVLEHALPLPITARALDIVGTGGDHFSTVNVSTMASIVAAAAGVPVVKHGNRAASSNSGSSDVLAELGVSLTLSPERVAAVFEKTGLTFAYAAAFHPGFRHVGPVRSQLGVPTVFNILGPLCNPARPEASAVGVARLDRVPLIAGVFQTRGATALVFRGDDGLDELTTTGHSHLWEITRGTIKEHDLDPRELGIPRATHEQLRGGDPAHNADVARRVLAGERGAVRDIVVLNAAAGLAAFELAEHPDQSERPILERLAEKLAVAEKALDSGAAATKLRQWAAVTQA
ncbi:MAG: anthranilate phosphoribosyltransferase [Candidatus Lumbricidophila eiseniae]|uniref:Anthranilate phosphoribosyltransferase n=1 Tax=Candidatus Lumbricidiphila eiseniae TaxID=1969409 RepID=A0A2A6FRT5_9MICO|nr:MAG: anthranilate phosphoribosyltransferase [Candidatus Lumbricidophila eiseniae]